MLIVRKYDFDEVDMSLSNRNKMERSCCTQWLLHFTIFLIYLTLALLPGGLMILAELDRNPQGEFCESINYKNLKYSKNDLGFVYVFPKFVPYDPDKHSSLSALYYPSINGNNGGANWVSDGLPCKLQFNALIILFLPGFLVLSLPAILLFRSIIKKYF